MQRVEECHLLAAGKPKQHFFASGSQINVGIYVTLSLCHFLFVHSHPTPSFNISLSHHPVATIPYRRCEITVKGIVF